MGHGEVANVAAVTGVQSTPADVNGAQPPRSIQRRKGVPGSRAVLGALLMTVAALGTFVAWLQATHGPSEPVVIARHAIRVGDVIESDDLQVVHADLPSSQTGSFRDAEALIGRIALGPIGVGELVQAAAVTDERDTGQGHEIALTLPRAQLAVGHLAEGERVDVFVTHDDRTRSVVRGVQVVQIGATGDGSLTDERAISIVVAVPDGNAVAALVHALRTGDVTVVLSTFARLDDGAPLEVRTDPPDDGADEEPGAAGG